jgi:hypothetical protein
MKVKLAIAAGIALLLIIVAIIGWYIYNKPHQGIAGSKTDITIKAGDLYKDFERNEAVANKKYLNKIIEVTGNIAEVQDVNGTSVILLEAENEAGGISCQLTNDENNKKILEKKPSEVTVKGKCSGFLIDVNLVDCVLR